MPHLYGATMSTTMYFACKGTNNLLLRKQGFRSGHSITTMSVASVGQLS